MASPPPAKPSSRALPRFTIAAAIGVAFFGIWWSTSPGRFDSRSQPEAVTAGATTASPSPPVAAELKSSEIAFPRGGSLTGAVGVVEESLGYLTQAPLVRINRSSDALEPWIAESWTASPDNVTYTVTLRRGLLWSDGTTVSLEDVVAALNAIGSGMPAESGGRFTARAVDQPIPPTSPMVEIRFAQPFAPGLRILDGHPIRARHKPPDTVGLGPFVLQAEEKGSGTRTLIRNTHYWRRGPDGKALPYIDELKLTELGPGGAEPEPAGALDFRDESVRPDDYEALKKLEQSGKGRLFELGPGLDAHVMWFSAFAPSELRRDKSESAPGSAPAVARSANASNSAEARSAKASNNDKPWLTSETFRLAISAAVDRRQFCVQVYFGACDPIAGPVTPANAAWFNPDLPLGRGDALLARKMLVDLGLRDRTGDGVLEDAAGRRVRFSLLVRRDVPSSMRAATFLKETLHAAGIEVEISPLDAAAMAARRMKGNYEAVYDSIAFRDTDPAMNLDFWLSSGAAHVWKTTRQGREADWEREIDQLMLKNASSFDRIERLQAFAEVQRIYSRHMPALFFGAPRVRIFTSPRVLNATPSPLRPHLLWNADSLAALQ